MKIRPLHAALLVAFTCSGAAQARTPAPADTAASAATAALRVNDRGPTQDDRAGDVSPAAARKLGMTRTRVIDAQLEVVAAR
jgi:hypothetical protein